MTKAPTPTEMSKGQNDNTNNATKKFDYRVINTHNCDNQPLWQLITSISAILQLYSDGTVVQFPNLDLLLDTQRHRQLRFFSVSSHPGTGTGKSEGVFKILAIGGPTRRELNQDLPIRSPARYLFPTAAGF